VDKSCTSKFRGLQVRLDSTLTFRADQRTATTVLIVRDAGAQYLSLGLGVGVGGGGGVGSWIASSEEQVLDVVMIWEECTPAMMLFNMSQPDKWMLPLL